jgi:hypothetical protein
MSCFNLTGKPQTTAERSAARKAATIRAARIAAAIRRLEYAKVKR